MPTIVYPNVLRIPLVSGFSRVVQPSFKESQPEGGPPYTERVTFDTPATWEVQFLFTKDYARLFWQWYIEQTEEGNLEFEIPLAIEAGIYPQLCKFTRDGLPRLTKKEGRHYWYSATLRSRSINDPDAGSYETLLAQLTPDG